MSRPKCWMEGCEEKVVYYVCQPTESGGHDPVGCPTCERHLAETAKPGDAVCPLSGVPYLIGLDEDRVKELREVHLRAEVEVLRAKISRMENGALEFEASFLADACPKCGAALPETILDWSKAETWREGRVLAVQVDMNSHGARAWAEEKINEGFGKLVKQIVRPGQAVAVRRRLVKDWEPDPSIRLKDGSPAQIARVEEMDVLRLEGNGDG